MRVFVFPTERLKRKMRNKRLYTKRKEAGLCVKCGIEKPVPGLTFCARCGMKEADANKRWRRRNKDFTVAYDMHKKELRRKNGLCVICGAPLALVDFAGIVGRRRKNRRSCMNCSHRPRTTYI